MTKIPLCINNWYLEAENWPSSPDDDEFSDILIYSLNFVLGQYVSIFGKEELEKYNVLIRNSTDGPRAAPFRLQTDSNIIDFFTANKIDYQLLLYSEELNLLQLIFQASHEISHILMDAKPTVKKFEWISECLCDAAIIYILSSTQHDAAFPYKRIALNYLGNMLNSAHEQLPSKTTMDDYLVNSLQSLERDPCGPIIDSVRWRNILVGYDFYKTISKNPIGWTSIIHIPDNVSPNEDSIAFLHSWLNNCPNEEQKQFVSDIILILDSPSEI